MWIYKGNELGVEGITGVPSTDLTDEEFANYSKMIDQQFAEDGSLAKCGLWAHVGDTAKTSEPSSSSSSSKESDNKESDKVTSTEKGGQSPS